MPTETVDIAAAIERCFRKDRAEIVETLSGVFGPRRHDDIENAVQSAAETALSAWHRNGIPDNPIAWFIAVARNRLVDMTRHEAMAIAKAGEAAAALAPDIPDEPTPTGPLEDDVLKMMLVCSHPLLSAKESAVITLRLVCNLGTEEIVKGLLSTTAAIKKTLQRAKQTIRDRDISFELPPPGELDARLDRVLQCLYLLFNEGYAAYVGDSLIRRELCVETERLVSLLLKSSLTDKGRIWALAALFAFQSSRSDARTDSAGRLLRLADQDRSRWDRDKISYGFTALGRSMQSDAPSRYHLEAGIAGYHAAAATYDQTDWHRIRELYDDLAEVVPSPVIELNRSVAILMTEGAEAAIAHLAPIESSGELKDMYLLPALLGDFHRRAGDAAAAKRYYTKAFSLSATKPVQDHLLGQIEECAVS